MKAIRFIHLPIILVLSIVVLAPLQSCDPDDNIDNCDTGIVAYKPNIYIYPEEQVELSVNINFPMGGEIIASIPEYGNGWNVTVDPDGTIDNTYSYLFYESKQPNVWQRNNGWSIETDKLESFFTENMKDYGFNDDEISDFTEYWIPLLNTYPAYSIFPQTNSTIEKAIQLDFSKTPENILRLFYVIEGHDKIQSELTAPIINSFKREGYVVAEWGVIL